MTTSSFSGGQLQAFVHHGGRIDGNFPAHAPVGVFYRLLGGDVLERSRVGVEKGAARGGEDDGEDAVLVQTACVVARQYLEHGVVFAVDRHHGCAVGAGGLHKQRAGYDQGFFVGQINGFAFLRRRQRGRQPRRADDGAHHAVHAVGGCDVG